MSNHDTAGERANGIPSNALFGTASDWMEKAAHFEEQMRFYRVKLGQAESLIAELRELIAHCWEPGLVGLDGTVGMTARQVELFEEAIGRKRAPREKTRL